MAETGMYWLQVWPDQYQNGRILSPVFQPKTNRHPPNLSVDGPIPEGKPDPVELHAIHTAARSIDGRSPPAGAISYTAEELEAAGGTLVYDPLPDNPYHYNVEFLGLSGLPSNELKRARAYIAEQLRRGVLDWTPPS